MTKELTTITPDKAVVAVGGEIDTIINQCMPVTTQENQNFVQALTLANGIKALRKIFLTTPQIKETVQAMQNTPLGFMTDRTDLAIWKSKQPGSKKELKPYRYEEVAEVCIEGMLQGYRITNNEFNMLVGRFYAAKNGKFRKIQEHKGVTDFQFTTTSPQYEQGNGGVQYAKVQGFASWKKDGQLVTLGSSTNTNAEDRLIFKIRVNRSMGEDAVTGKALSKLFSRVLMRIDGRLTPEATDVDVIDAEFDGEHPTTDDAQAKLDELKKRQAEEANEAAGKEQGDETHDIDFTPPDGPPVSDTEASYFEQEFKDLRSTFQGKLIHHINSGMIKEATAEDIRALHKKWASSKETMDKPFPLDEKPKTEENQPQREPENWIGLYYGCPDMDGKAIAKARCRPENCEKYEGCPNPYKPDAPTETGEDVAV